MRNIEKIPSEKTFVEWAAASPFGMELTEAEASMLLGYVEGHGCGASLDETGAIILVDTEEPENGIVARGIDELLDRVTIWNYELILDSEIVGAQREQILKDAEDLERLMEGVHLGYPLGTPTVKELIDALSSLPEDYRVTCCGAECFVHLFAQDKYITIDNEHYLT